MVTRVLSDFWADFIKNNNQHTLLVLLYKLTLWTTNYAKNKIIYTNWSVALYTKLAQKSVNEMHKVNRNWVLYFILKTNLSR